MGRSMMTPGSQTEKHLLNTMTGACIIFPSVPSWARIPTASLPCDVGVEGWGYRVVPLWG